MAGIFGKRFVLQPLLFVLVLTFALRWYDQNYRLAKDFVDTQPSEEQLMMPNPPFCTGVKPGMENKFFYFDLGGTYCACEKQWNIGEYWRKTMSGLAFNLPHFIDALVACLVFGDLKVIIFVVFMNEFVEEFIVAVSIHWGFNGDPAWDLEPRYDSLMRDVVHCMVGVWLAASVMRITYQTGWMDARGMLATRSFLDLGPAQEAPRGIILFRPRHLWMIFSQEGTDIAASDPLSAIRLWRLVISYVVFWQIFLLYNLDAGIRAFSLHNILLSALVALWFITMFNMNSCHMPNVPRRRLAIQHVVPAVICVVSCMSCIYPPMPTIYLIMLLEGTSKISLTIFEVVLAKFPGLRSWMQLDVENDEFDVQEVMQDAMMQLGCGRDSGVPLGHVALLDVMQAFMVDQQHGDIEAKPAEHICSVDIPDVSRQLRLAHQPDQGRLPGKEAADAPRGSQHCQALQCSSLCGLSIGRVNRASSPCEGEKKDMPDVPGVPQPNTSQLRTGAACRTCWTDTSAQVLPNLGGKTGSAASQHFCSMLQRKRDEKVRNNCPLATGKGRFRTAFNILFSLSIMIFALNQPFMYEGTTSLTGDHVNIQYARHWCGNPNGPRDNVNTCLGPPGSTNGH